MKTVCNMRLTCGEETVVLSRVSNGEFPDMILCFHHDGKGGCDQMYIYQGKNGFAPIGILFGMDDNKRTARAEAVVSYKDGVPTIDRKGLRVKTEIEKYECSEDGWRKGIA